MNILVLGASGMAGHVIATHLIEHGHTVTPLAGHRKVVDGTVVLDLLDKKAFEDFLSNHEFDVVVNAAGILIKESETRKDLAAYLNGFLPHYLEAHFADTKTKLIHLSTDCVFSGQNGPYREDSPYDGDTFYDRSKALGEVINDKDLTIRMSIIGPDPNPEASGLFDWFMKQHGTISGFSKVIWNGVTTIELAKGIGAAIEQNLTDLYHFSPTQTISKYDLLQLCKEVFNKNELIITPKDAPESNKTLLNTRRDFDYIVPDYETMIREMRAWIEKHKNLYPQYTI